MVNLLWSQSTPQSSLKYKHTHTHTHTHTQNGTKGLGQTRYNAVNVDSYFLILHLGSRYLFGGGGVGVMGLAACARLGGKSCFPACWSVCGWFWARLREGWWAEGVRVSHNVGSSWRQLEWMSLRFGSEERTTHWAALTTHCKYFLSAVVQVEYQRVQQFVRRPSIIKPKKFINSYMCLIFWRQNKVVGVWGFQGPGQVLRYVDLKLATCTFSPLLS